jgi:hypothetical protein
MAALIHPWYLRHCRNSSHSLRIRCCESATDMLSPLGMIQTPATMGRAIPIIETRTDPNIINPSSDTPKSRPPKLLTTS